MDGVYRARICASPDHPLGAVSHQRPDECKSVNNVRRTNHDCDSDNRLTEPLRTLLVARERPDCAADNESQPAKDPRCRAAQIVEETLKGPCPRHNRPTADR